MSSFATVNIEEIDNGYVVSTQVFRDEDRKNEAGLFGAAPSIQIRKFFSRIEDATNSLVGELTFAFAPPNANALAA